MVPLALASHQSNIQCNTEEHTLHTTIFDAINSIHKLHLPVNLDANLDKLYSALFKPLITNQPATSKELSLYNTIKNSKSPTEDIVVQLLARDYIKDKDILYHCRNNIVCFTALSRSSNLYFRRSCVLSVFLYIVIYSKIEALHHQPVISFILALLLAEPLHEYYYFSEDMIGHYLEVVCTQVVLPRLHSVFIHNTHEKILSSLFNVYLMAGHYDLATSLVSGSWCQTHIFKTMYKAIQNMSLPPIKPMANLCKYQFIEVTQPNEYWPNVVQHKVLQQSRTKSLPSSTLCLVLGGSLRPYYLPLLLVTTPERFRLLLVPSNKQLLDTLLGIYGIPSNQPIPVEPEQATIATDFTDLDYHRHFSHFIEDLSISVTEEVHLKFFNNYIGKVSFNTILGGEPSTNDLFHAFIYG